MRQLVIFSGAGLSAESGLDTFRDNNGLWAKYDPAEVCNYANWIRNFDLVHRFYNLRRAKLAKVEPNAMHKFLANLKIDNVKITHLTQNVDDLLERAGASNVVHLHGELVDIICPNCGSVFHIGYGEFKRHNCPKCDYDKLKPKIVFFGENAPEYVRLYEIIESMTHKDCLLVIGTSGNVIDISSIIAMKEIVGKIGCKILNNLAYSEHIAESYFDLILYKKSSEAIGEIRGRIEDFFKGF